MKILYFSCQRLCRESFFFWRRRNYFLVVWKFIVLLNTFFCRIQKIVRQFVVFDLSSCSQLRIDWSMKKLRSRQFLLSAISCLFIHRSFMLNVHHTCIIHMIVIMHFFALYYISNIRISWERPRLCSVLRAWVFLAQKLLRLKASDCVLVFLFSPFNFSFKWTSIFLTLTNNNNKESIGWEQGKARG